jgi:hypothetical protein
MVASDARTYPRVEHLRGTSLGLALALLTNIRLGWEGLSETNTRACKQHSELTDVKSFLTLGLGGDVASYFPFATAAPSE